MEPGTLYGALSRLERRGWVRPLATDERRRPYQITAAGQAVLAEQLKRPCSRSCASAASAGDSVGRVMRPALAARLSRALVGCYPRRWRERYGAELLEVLDQHRPGARTVLNLAASALGAHLDRAYRAGVLPMIAGTRRASPSPLSSSGASWCSSCSRPSWSGRKSGQGRGPPLSQGGVFGVAFSPDGRTVVTISTTMKIWNVGDPAHPERLGYSPGDAVGGTDPAFSPNGRILATGGGKAEILWNMADPGRPTQIAVLPAYPGATGPFAFSPDGRTLASGYADGTVALWNTADPARVTRIATLTRQAGGIAALSFSPGGHLLASASDGGAVALWNVALPGPRHPDRHPDRAGPAALPRCRSPPAGTCWPARATTAPWPCGTLPARLGPGRHRHAPPHHPGAARPAGRFS